MKQDGSVSRRRFLGGTLAATAVGSFLAANGGRTEDAASGAVTRKIKIGVIGGGGRGKWISRLFKTHGGYEAVAVADYFQPVANALGGVLGVPAERCYSGLSGYKKVIESGIEALVIEDVPYFYPEQAQAAVEAGLHVYIAKPVAVDVPGCLAIEAAGKLATKKQRVFLVDYQMPTDPLNAEVVQRMRDGAVGALQTVFSNGAAGGGGFNDPPLTGSIESRLRGLVWVNDDALGCGYIGNYDIHVVDAVLWAVGRKPVAAYGWGARFRKQPHGDAMDTTCVMYTFDDGMVWNHQSPKGTSDDWFSSNGSLTASFQGSDASARLAYWNKAFIRGGMKHYGGGKVENLYQAGAERNIAAFHRNITEGRFENGTVARAVDGCLVCILGREAAARRTRLTMAEVLEENRKLEVNLTGLKT